MNALLGGEVSLERWRSEGIGPKFLKLPGRVLYRQIDIEAFEESCLSTSTKVLIGPVRGDVQVRLPDGRVQASLKRESNF